MRPLLTIAVLLAAAAPAAAQGCSDWISASPVYDPDTCRITAVRASHYSYSSCGSPNPTSLWVRFFRDAPSDGPYTAEQSFALGCYTGGCGSNAPQNCDVAITNTVGVGFPTSWDGHFAYMELWQAQTNGLYWSYCGDAGQVAIDMPPAAFIEGGGGGAGIGMPSAQDGSYQIEVQDAPPGATCLLFSSTSQGCPVPFANGSTSLLCAPTRLVGAAVASDGPISPSASVWFTPPDSLYGRRVYLQWQYRRDGAAEVSNVGTLFHGCT